jgi:E3 ubiquitin-protein ligase BRE1
MDGMNAEATEEVSKESEDIKILQEQLRESRENQQKMKDQLEMHRNVLKDVRTSAQIADSQKRLMDEINAMKSSIAKIKNQSDGRSKLESEDHEEWTKYKSLEQKVHSLQMQVTKQKSDQDALANDIEAIGEAYEDTNEQLVLLGHQFQKMDKDSVRLFARLGGATRLTNIVDADVQVVRDKKTALEREIGDREECRKVLDDRHALTLGTVVRLEQEDLERRYAAEVGKRVAIQRGQEAQDLSLQLETCIKNMVHVEQIKEEKSRALEGEAFRATQLQKEIALVKREVVRLETIEMTGSSTDEVRLEEVNELREALKCPSCQVRLKDAVLTICYHVFCFECLRTRYESRQRKCPKCNAAFGANDYKYIKLSEDDDDDFDKY